MAATLDLIESKIATFDKFRSADPENPTIEP